MPPLLEVILIGADLIDPRQACLRLSVKARKSVYKALREGDVALVFGDGKFSDSGLSPQA